MEDKEYEPKQGYCITTYTLKLYTNHKSYFKLTQEKYNIVIGKYYRILLKYEEMLDKSSRECEKELAKLTGKTKDGKKGKEYFELDMPRELKRTAMTMAIRYAKIYVSLLKRAKNDEIIGIPAKAKKFNLPVTYWSDMRRNIQDDGKFQMKLCTRREGWKWIEVKLKDWEKIKGLETLSPTIVIKKDYLLARIPVRHKIADVMPVKNRLQNNNVRVCGVAFSNSNHFAICTILDAQGNFIKSLFVSGGDEYRHRTAGILNKIYRDKCEIKQWQMVKNDHEQYWNKLRNINEYYAHNVSRKIVTFCVENKVDVIAVADLNSSSADTAYYYKKKIKKYTPIYLRPKITQYLKYKAFQEGILLKLVSPNHTASKCYHCGGLVKRGKDELKVTCENGHHLDYFFNSAMNIGRACLENR